jgi:c-di-GMP-binding flagellar brake protein YcgR
MSFAMREQSLHEREIDRELAGGVRSAVRFPLHLPIRVIANDEEYSGESENFSSGGVLLRLDRKMDIGVKVEFLVEIPAGVLGMQTTAAIHCSGRALRAYEKDGVDYCAVVIDEYRFQ